MRSAWKSLALLSVVVVVFGIGCGGDDGPKSLGGDVPECADGQLIVEGTLDGNIVSQNLTGYSTFTFTNVVGTSRGSFNVGFPDGNAVFVEFTDFADPNEIVAARGFVDFEATSGPKAGYCDTMSVFAGELLVPLDEVENQWEFSITRLREPEQYCANDELSGELVGCFRPRP